MSDKNETTIPLPPAGRLTPHQQRKKQKPRDGWRVVRCIHCLQVFKTDNPPTALPKCCLACCRTGHATQAKRVEDCAECVRYAAAIRDRDEAAKKAITVRVDQEHKEINAPMLFR